MKIFFEKLIWLKNYWGLIFEIPALLLLFLETKAHFEMLYLLKQLSWPTLFFKFFFYLVILLQFVTPLHEIQFCCQSCDLIFPPKTVGIEKQKHTIVWNTKFYHPGNIELKRIKKCKSSSWVVTLGVMETNTHLHLLEHHNSTRGQITKTIIVTGQPH